MRFRQGLMVAAAVAVLAPLSATGAAAASPDDELKRVRAATAKYHSEKLAIKHGYLRTDECVPGMGYHYVNPARFTSTDPLKPGALIYAPHKDGKSRKLIAVEYFVIDEDQDVETHNTVIPSMFGKQYDGPMPGHAPGMPVHYDLHAYVWTNNPNGVLATWNPNVVCPPH
jgi:hypothetical protein